jgi:hypothetical protein
MPYAPSGSNRNGRRRRYTYYDIEKRSNHILGGEGVLLLVRIH